MAYVRAYNQTPSDESNIEINFFNQSNTALSNFVFGPYNQDAIWKKIDTVLRAPAGARTVRITLHSVRHNGTNNDGYYDELYLGAVPTGTNPFESKVDTTICDGQSYHGHKTSGTYNDTLSTANGCDSIIVTHLKIKPRSFSTIYNTICEGQKFLGHDKSGAYTDTLLAANGCDSVRTLQLLVTPSEVKSQDIRICEGEKYFAGRADQSITGIYYDTIFSNFSCPVILKTNLTVGSKLNLNLGSDTILCKESFINLDAGNFSAYTWSNNSSGRFLKVTAPGLYWVKVLDTFKCAIIDTIIIKEANCNEVQIPNVFSPNGDGTNDTWKIPFLASYPNCKLSVYNRYGQLVFQSTGYRTDWNGTYKAQTLPFGTYYWLIDLNNRKAPLSGSVMIIY